MSPPGSVSPPVFLVPLALLLSPSLDKRHTLSYPWDYVQQREGMVTQEPGHIDQTVRLVTTGYGLHEGDC
jgi:hypothetical protein